MRPTVEILSWPRSLLPRVLVAVPVECEAPMKVLRDNRVIEEYTPKRVPQRGWRVTPTDTGSRILEAIRDAERRGDVPSMRQLVKVCSISSTSVVQYHLRQLARAGDLELGERGAARAYRLTAQGRGLPSDAELLAQCLAQLEWYGLRTDTPLIEALRERLRE
jgi:hypothetical protein